MRDSGESSNKQVYLEIAELLQNVIHNSETYWIPAADLAIIRDMLKVLEDEDWADMNYSLKFRVELRVDGSLIFRSVILDKDGLYLQTGLSERGYDSQYYTVFPYENSSDHDFKEERLRDFFPEFFDLLGYDDRIIITEEEENNEEEPDDDDRYDVIEAAESYTRVEVAVFIKNLIRHFDEFGISGIDVGILSKIYAVLINPSHYRVHGYLYFTVKEVQNEDNMLYNEIHLDEDGLRLTIGSYLTEGDFGGDSDSWVILPCEDEEDASNIVQTLELFINSFKEKLSKRDTLLIEAVDSGDEIELLNKPTRNNDIR